MSGNSLVVDTNILIYQLNGDKTIESVLENKGLFLSFITKIELLTYQKLSPRKENLIEEIFDYASIVHSNDTITELAIQLRTSYSLKTPDAIILATAAYLRLPLFTADQDLFKVKEIEIFQYIL